MSWKSKYANKQGGFSRGRPTKSQEEIEADQLFDQLRNKYANVIAFLLIKGVKQSELRAYFAASDENKRRYECIKKFRQSMVDARPKAKQWIDKSFYIGLKLGEVELNETTLTNQCQVIHGDTIFKQSTNVVSNRYELDLYMDAIAKIIESERIWSDPDMADFDIGERDSGSLKLAKRMRQKKINTAVVDPINDCNEEAKEEGPTDNLDLEASDDEDSEKENKEPIHGGENCVRMTRARLRTTVE